MIVLCPYCGSKLHRALKDGISSCEHCTRVFDTSSYHSLLSAAWMCRQWNVDAEVAQKKCGLNDAETAIIREYEGFSHDEFARKMHDYCFS
jgi:hypothetical protein